MVAGKLGLVPRYRQKVRFVPLGAGPPVWIDDPHFSLDYHLRHAALPATGSEEQLRQMAGRVFSQHLDRNKPLWELWMVEGLHGGRWALLSKAHHCMVDGVAATDLMSVMFLRHHRRRINGRLLAGARALRDRDPDPDDRPASQSGRSAGGAARCPAGSPPVAALVRRNRTRNHRGRAQHAPGGRLVADRADRAPPDLELGGGAPDRRQGGEGRTRRHRQRRRAHAHHERLPRAAPVPRRGRPGGPRDPHDGARLGPAPRRARGLQQPRLRGLRGAARGSARSRSPAGVDPRGDGRRQELQAGGRGRRPDLALGIRSAAAARAGQPPRHALTAAEHAHRHHQRARATAARADARAADARVLPLRARRRIHPHRGRDLQLRRRALLRRHRRLRRRPRRRSAHGGHRARDGRPARARRAPPSSRTKSRTARAKARG